MHRFSKAFVLVALSCAKYSAGHLINANFHILGEKGSELRNHA